jgi:hypothetical protein
MGAGRNNAAADGVVVAYLCVDVAGLDTVRRLTLQVRAASHCSSSSFF